MSVVGLAAKVGRLDSWILAQGCCLALMNHGSRFKDVCTVGDPERTERVLLHEQHRHSLRRQFAYGRENLLGEDWRDPHAWLVQHQEPRACGQGSCNRKHLLLPPGKRARHRFSPLGEGGEELIHLLECSVEV